MSLDAECGFDAGRAPVSELEKLVDIMRRDRNRLRLARRGGVVSSISSDRVTIDGLQSVAGVGSAIELGTGTCFGQVIGVCGSGATVKLTGSSASVLLRAPAWLSTGLVVRPSEALLGRVVDAVGRAIDGGPPLVDGEQEYAIEGQPLGPMELRRIATPCATGVRAIDVFTPICIGQRIGLFAGSGVGKSTLVSMICRAPGFQAVVIALVAERAREVLEFVEDVVRPNCPRAVTVVATSSEDAMMRKNCAQTAMGIAEYFRDQGDNVLIVIDSLTRYAHALREVAIESGELPVARGYPPSVFANTAKLLERAGPGKPGRGSITGIFSVLVDGDDHNEPISDAVRGIVDGHIVLQRAIAAQGRFPAIDIELSLSRIAELAWTDEQARLVRILRRLVGRYEESREARGLGSYKTGVDLELDTAVANIPTFYKFLSQAPGDSAGRDVFSDLAAALKLDAMMTTTESHPRLLSLAVA